MNARDIGKNIRILRIERSLTQQDLANKTNLSKSMISFIENGHRLLNLNQLVRIAGILKVFPDAITTKPLFVHAQKITTIKAFGAFKNGEIMCHGPASYAIFSSKSNAETLFSNWEEIKPVTIHYKDE